MKYYVLLTANIYDMGGMQSYVSAKVKYLKEHQWIPRILYPGEVEAKDTFYESLNEFKLGGFQSLKYLPYLLSGARLNSELKDMVSYIGCKEGDTVIIESQNDVLAIWGEILAEKVKGKNFCFLCNEIFRGKNKYYEDNLDYFEFKYKRNEIATINENCMNLLFEGRMKIQNGRKYVLVASDDVAVVDYPCHEIESIDNKKKNITYMGRMNKEYVPAVCKAVVDYARKNPMIFFRFIMVGEGKCKSADREIENKPQNLEVCKLGGFVPIPKKLFEISDVIIASAGCAIIAAGEGAKVIVPDSDSGKALGVYGYTMDSWVYSNEDKEYTYEYLLNEILFQNRYQGPFKYEIQKLEPSKDFDEHFKYIGKSSEEKSYFKFSNRRAKQLSIKKRIGISLINTFGSNIYSKIYRMLLFLKVQ